MVERSLHLRMFSAVLAAVLASVVTPVSSGAQPVVIGKSGESVSLDAFDLPPGGQVTIEFEVTIDNPVLGGATSVMNQMTVTGDNFTSVLSDDPDAGGAADKTTTLLLVQADLAIAKSDSADPVDAGSAFSYTLNVTNNGPDTATSVAVTDTLPMGVAFVSASGSGWTCNEAAGVVTCTRPSLAVGAAPAITINVTAPAAGGMISNTASVDGAEADSTAGNDSDAETTTVTAVADLSITKSDSADPVDASAAFSYTLNVTNGGPSTATSLTVADTLPIGVAFVSASGTGWTCNELSGVVTCTRPSLAVGSAPAITINVTAPAAAGMLSNTASVDGAESDPAAGNDSDGETTNVTAVADLGISKSDSADPVDATAAFSYTLNVTNNGPSAATSLTVTDTLPAGVGFVSASGTGWTCNEAAGVVTCTRPSLAVGAAPAITINVTAPAAGGMLSNTASVAGAESDPAAGNDSDVETTNVAAVADLAITKSDSADPVNGGAAFSYTLAVTDNGPSAATSLTVTDTLPTGVGFVSASGTGWTCNEVAGVVTCTRPSLAVGAAPAITINVTAPAVGGMLSNTASVAGAESDPAAGNDSDVETTNVTVADLSIAKSDSADPVNASAAFSYTLAVTNNGPSTATSLAVTDTLPAGVGFVSASGTGWTCNEAAGVVTCTRPSLAVGAAPAITINVTAPSAGGMLSNTASVAGAESDPAAGNDSDVETTDVTAVADLGVTKTAPPGIVTGGQALAYTVTVNNAGPSTATSVTVTDGLPAGVAYVSASGTGWTCNEAAGTVTCTRPTLAVGSAPAITINVTVDSPPLASIVNTASVAGTQSDPNSANDEGSATVTSDLVPPAVVSVTASPGGSLSDCVTVARRVQRLRVVFSKPMQSSGGMALEAGDADNPASYLLVGPGADLDFATLACGAPQGDDVAVPVASIAYVADKPAAPQSTATLTLGAPLADGLYRFFACDAKDTGGNVLDDFVIDLFRVDFGNLFTNGHFDCDAAGWSAVGAAVPVHDPAADAGGSPLSGSLAFTAQGAMRGVEQCAGLAGSGPPYDLSLRLRLDGVPASSLVQFLADCAFYGGAACSGTLLQAGSLDPLVISGSTGGNWLLLTGELTPPAGAASAQCDAVASGPPAVSFGVRLDRLRLQGSDEIFSDGFESGDTSAWTSTKN